MTDVANYNIENNSGANVRIDLNAVFSAIQSSNSKSTDLATSQCVAGMPFLNTTSKILKIRNSSNGGFTDIGNIDQDNLGVLPRTGGVLTGVLGLPNASASAPSIHFGDTTTGFFRKGSNQIGVAFAGSEKIFFDQNAVNLNDSKSVRFFELASNGSVFPTDDNDTVAALLNISKTVGSQNVKNIRSGKPLVPFPVDGTTIVMSTDDVNSKASEIAGFTKASLNSPVIKNLRKDYEDDLVEI